MYDNHTMKQNLTEKCFLCCIFLLQEKVYHHIPLVVANPYNGCSELLNKRHVDRAVVLIQRG